MNATPPIDALVIGKIAVLVQRSPLEIRRVADRLGIRPAILLNDTPYYSRADVDRIDAALWPNGRDAK